MTMAAFFASSQEFVRALKGTSDPPQLGGLHKIEIARQAWDNTSFHVPNKGEVIVDWIVTTFSKEKNANAHAGPLTDIRFWMLLQDILVHTSASEKSWLPPLLNRTSLAPIVRTFLNLLRELDLSTGRLLCAAVKSCLRVLWLISSQRFPTEILLECFGTSLQVASKFPEVEECLYVCHLITSSYRHNLANSSNKKKIYATFMQAHFEDWVQLAGTLTWGSVSSAYQDLLADMYSAGVETIFNLDVLRQMKEASWEEVLVQTLRTTLISSPDKILSVLPILFSSFIQSIRRQRGALFGQSDSIRSAATTFYLSIGSMMDTLTESELLWKTRAALLTIVDKEGLMRVPNEDLQTYLVHTRDTAIAALSWKGDAQVFSPHALVFLASLAHIDYDLVDNALQSILPRLMLIPPDTSFVSKLWDLVVEHHSKTRTMGTLILNILTATKDQYLFRLTDTSLNYQLCCTGSVFSPSHLERLSKSIRIFLTPSQCSSSTSVLINDLKQTWSEFNEADALLIASASGEGKRKKRRKSAAGGNDRSDDAESRAVTLSLICKLVASFVSGLPLHSLIEEDRTAILSELAEAFQFVCTECNTLIQTFRSAERNETWAAQVVLSSGLRLAYSMQRTHALGLHRRTPLSTQLEQLIPLTNNPETLPELAVEIFRNLLAECATSRDPVVLDKCLAYIDQNLRPQTAKWSGAGCQLVVQPVGREAASIALLKLLFDRWLHLLDETASEAQAIRLIQVLFNLLPCVNVGMQDSPHMDSARIFGTLMYSAEFWELSNLRSAFFSVVEEKLKPLSHVVFSDTRTAKSLKKLKLEPSQVLDACSAYKLLLYSPPEYMTRSIRSTVCQRVSTIDGALELMKRKEIDVDEQLTALREFSIRMCRHAALTEPSLIAEYLEYLVDSLSSDMDPSATLLDVTLELIEAQFICLLQSSERQTEQRIVMALDRFGNMQWTSHQPNAEVICVLRLLAVISRDFNKTRLSAAISTSLTMLHGILAEHVTSVLDRQLTEIISVFSPEVSVWLQAWSEILAFGNWLHDEKSVQRFFGRDMACNLLKASRPSGIDGTTAKVVTHVVTILYEELRGSSTSTRHMHLALIVSLYVNFASEASRSLDLSVSSSCSKLPLQDFSVFLDILYKVLAQSLPQERLTLVHLSRLVLREAPQGTLKLVQEFASRCLLLFADASSQMSTADQDEVLSFIEQYCSDKPAAVKVADLNCILTVVATAMSESPIHDSTTNVSIFHRIVSVLSALIRLRRDLLLHSLPHLGMLLRKLVTTLRTVRPGLSAKQARTVMHTLPKWISSSRFLSIEEGRALARLIVALTTKTVPRSFARPDASLAESQKAESLAKPFAKHAAYVLTAYIDVLNDSLCILKAEMRREMEPGIFALCSIMGEHSRDAVMLASLDASGKNTMKSLWKEYEKQRYVGRG